MSAYVPLLGVLAAIWGSSFLFIEVALGAMEPTALTSARVTLAALTLLAYLAVRGELSALRRAPRGAYLLGIVSAAIPFTLIALGQRHVDSGTAAVANAGVPLFVAMIAFGWGHSERASGSQLAGMLVGLAGVAWLVMMNPTPSWQFIAGTAMICAAAVSYAVGALYGQHLVTHVSGPVIATAAYIGASVVLLPLGVLHAPGTWPGTGPLLALLVLSVLGTGVGQLLWFALLARYGSSRASLTTYIVPVFALVYGAALLAEPVGWDKVGALVLILGGVALASARRPVRPSAGEVIGLEARSEVIG